MVATRSQTRGRKSHYYVVAANLEAIEILEEGEFDMNNREVLGEISDAAYERLGVKKDGRLKFDTNKHIVCLDCQAHYKEKEGCKLHPIYWVENSFASQGGRRLPYAERTIPPEYFYLSEDTIAGQGIKAARKIPVGLVFGPYKGIKTPTEECRNPGYSWHVTIKGKLFTVDAFDKTKGNWLRYVNSPNEETGGNMIPFQYQEKIYYKTIKVIQKDEEVLVWYGEQYGKELRNLRASRQ
ncbi:hypothetical protein CAEBREN_18087 [Caenorhabditis brenneri]|uniref:SET domain-containing protein n=1 Tax=Caenorhabditis brenneri TaxID=135651 RepID=G0P588_CAEBE|nr:hypothetical protein CAEBREN_18087 [Caenorhabditis brenneri]